MPRGPAKTGPDDRVAERLCPTATASGGGEVWLAHTGAWASAVWRWSPFESVGFIPIPDLNPIEIPGNVAGVSVIPQGEGALPL